MERVPAQTTGQYYLAAEGTVRPFDASRSLLQIQQLSEEQILSVATATVPTQCAESVV